MKRENKGSFNNTGLVKRDVWDELKVELSVRDESGADREQVKQKSIRENEMCLVDKRAREVRLRNLGVNKCDFHSPLLFNIFK